MFSVLAWGVIFVLYVMLVVGGVPLWVVCVVHTVAILSVMLSFFLKNFTSRVILNQSIPSSD